MASTGEHLVTKFFPGTGASYDRVVRWTTLGRDAFWKRRLLARVPPSRRILELAAGTGILTAMLLDAHPEAHVTAVDITDDYLSVARDRFAGDPRIDFLLGDAVSVDLAGRGPFDAVVSSYLPKYVDPDRLLAHLGPFLAPGATFAMHDFGRPGSWLPRLVWRGWFGVLHLVAPRLHPEWRNVFDDSLLDLICRSAWSQDFLEALPRHGFEDVRLELLDFGTSQLVTARTPSA